MLEAMAQGAVPVVSGLASGIEETIIEGQTGHTFPVGEMERCADLIAGLAADRARLAAMSHEARALVGARLSLARYGQNLAALLRGTMERAPRLTAARYPGRTAHPLARLVPAPAIGLARKLLGRGGYYLRLP